jgi:MFS transporter, DHA1 family, multidrug resistance protein
MRGSRGAALVLMLTTSLAPLHAVAASPALIGIRSAFHISAADAQQTVSIFVLGYASSQLVFGPVANALGRVRALVLGMVIAVFGSLLAAFSAHWGGFDLLRIGRFLSGVGCGAGVVVGFTVANELYRGSRLRRVLGLCYIANAALPALASLGSGVIVQAVGWSGAFSMLAVYGSGVTLLSGLLLPETMRPSRRVPLRPRSALRGYSHAIRNSTLVLGGLTYAAIQSILYGLVALLPFLARERFGMQAAAYGTAFFVSYLGYLLGGILSTWVAGKALAKTVMRAGIITTGIGGLGFGALVMTHSVTALWVFSCVFVVFVGFPLILSNCTAVSISSHDDKANGSAVFATIYNSLCFVAVMVAGQVHGHYEYLMSVWIVGMAVVAFVLQLFLMRGGAAGVVSVASEPSSRL